MCVSIASVLVASVYSADIIIITAVDIYIRVYTCVGHTLDTPAGTHKEQGQRNIFVVVCHGVCCLVIFSGHHIYDISHIYMISRISLFGVNLTWAYIYSLLSYYTISWGYRGM